MANTTAVPLQQFIASLDNTCLPKIIQVCSGVYFQGSVYEISGSEVCFSTGDLIKITKIDLVAVTLEDVINNNTFELSINHKELFKVVPEQMPYNSIEEMLSLRPVGLESCLPFSFTCSSKMTFENLTLGAGTALTVLFIDGEQAQVHCRIQGQREASAEVAIPFSYRGEFYECENEERFTLQDIMSSACLRSRRFRFMKTTKSSQLFTLSPVYQVQAIMHLRKNVVKFPSTLEVDVVDVTEVSKDISFVTPLSLPEVLSQPDDCFPTVVEILERPESCAFFKCSWLEGLHNNEHLLFHKKGTSAMVLLSSLKSRKLQHYFLVTQQYGGRFRRRPREFNSVYELHVASVKAPGLKFSVTKNSEEYEEEGLPALSVGEQLEIVCLERMELPCGSNNEQKQSVEALLCQCLQEEDDDDDDDDDDDEDEFKKENEKKQILLPLYMQGHFVEVLTDNKKYKLTDLVKEFSFPLDIKVVNRDTKLETDPLFGLACVRIEGTLLEPTIQASFPHSPDECFEIPTRWLSMSVSFTKDPLPWPRDQPPQCHVERVIEVTDTFFYEFHKRGNSDETPPPRPPKRNLSVSSDPPKKPSKATKKGSKAPTKASKAHKSKHQENIVPTKELTNMTLNSKKRPPAPPPPDIIDDQPPPVTPRKHPVTELTTAKALPNTYVKIDGSLQKASFSDPPADVNSDHDYEEVNDNLSAMMKVAHENAMHY
ncbi:protein THEMIS2 [Echeneis naucrates]|uniref:protein THEMIS2 n=1 Tax=Echeneis naucrates TaxID=173247 RepID=UPI0011142B85|nr:protein THEMIS2 [Echeneis naucrates]XP_029360966.1 protein THEMIS2 [Echeneis naucrates]